VQVCETALNGSLSRVRERVRVRASTQSRSRLAPSFPAFSRQREKEPIARMLR